ncbi:hypothetical protein SLEP1_g50471 [Rubroshorea leprosula]|uniref:Integrase catalytic domain-containing protein n=1 Tax=Rubroshorea leprosula TaxID=152421 RepID=A0AAV5M104_9ROSI|nr:hypothetical protein SLEP1_g50471 [Rubroshorea leprosula]
MVITRTTSSCIADGNQELGQDDGWEVQQPCPSTDVFHDLLQGITDPSLASLVQVIQVQHEDQQMTTQLFTNCHPLPQAHRKLSDDDKRNPKYYRYHCFVHQATMDYFSLRRIYHRRVSEGLLEVPNRRQKVDEDPLPRHNQGVVNVFTHVESVGVGEPIIEFPDDMPSYSAVHSNELRSLKCYLISLVSLPTRDEEPQRPYSPSPMRLEENASTLKHMLAALILNLLMLNPSAKNCQGFGSNNELALGYVQLELKTETHFTEAAFYGEFTLFGEVTVSHLGGIALPTWNDIKDKPDLDLRSVLEHKRQKKEVGKVVQARPKPIVSSVAMSLDHLFFTSKGDTLIGERGLSNKVECLALEVGNEIVVEHLDFSGKANYLVQPDKLPTLHEAQPTLISLEPLKAVDLGDDPTNPRHVHINTTLSTDERAKMVKLLREYKDVFAGTMMKCWGLVAHSLNVDPNMRPVVQPNCAFHPKVTLKIKEEVENHLAAYPKDEFFVPNMDMLMDKTIGCEMYSLMDGSSGYNQVNMCPSDVEKTAFRTPIGKPFKVYLSTFDKTVSALVVQDDQEGKEQPVYYVSRNLKGAESSILFPTKSQVVRLPLHRNMRKNGHYISMVLSRLKGDLSRYVIISRELNYRLRSEILAKCVNDKEAYHRLREIHNRTCGHDSPVSLYRQVQRAGVQDWRHPYMEYFAEGIWPESLKDAHNLKRYLSKFFMDGGVLFRTNFADMRTLWPFHTWGLDLIILIHPSFEGYIWILVATEYFTKWVEAIPLRKATGLAVSNFIKEHIICHFGIPYKIASDHVRKNIAGPSKFTTNWDGPYIFVEAHYSGYYRLNTHKGESLLDPMNAKWLKPYYC